MVSVKRRKKGDHVQTLRSNGSTTQPLSDVTGSGMEAAKEMITALMMRRLVHDAVNKQHLIQGQNLSVSNQKLLGPAELTSKSIISMEENVKSSYMEVARAMKTISKL